MDVFQFRCSQLKNYECLLLKSHMLKTKVKMFPTSKTDYLKGHRFCVLWRSVVKVGVYLCLEPQVAQPSSLSLEESLDCFTATAGTPFREMMFTDDADWIISQWETGPGSSAMPSDAA